jgi:transposase
MSKEYFVNKLTEQDIRRLKDFDKEIANPNVHDRVRMVLLSHKGYNISRLSQILDLNNDDISKWLKRYESEGVTGLLNRPRSGRPAKITQQHIQLMIEVIEKSPRLYGYNRSQWDCNLLSLYLKKRTKVVISDEWVRLLLRRFGFRCGRGKLRIISPDPLYNKKKAI